MDNPEEVMQILERFNVQKNPEINPILEEYLQFVARTGDSVYAWALVKNLFREKLINVITDFHNEAPVKGEKQIIEFHNISTRSSSPTLFVYTLPELPQYPNVDPFNYETMKKMLLEKLDSFQSAPFTIQRISELLSEPRKQYSRVDKFMRAVEKTILVVSTIPPGRTRTESSDSLDSGLNGDYSDVNVDVDMDALESANHKKNNNHDENHETSAAPVDDAAAAASKEETVNGTITQVTVDSVSITVIEPERSKLDDTKVASPSKAAAALDEPIRSSENEILVETAELISETPPLAALENIVATTTTTTLKVDSTVVTPEIVVTSAAAVVITAQTEPAEIAERADETETKSTEPTSEEAAECEAKRMKLSEEETESSEVTAPTETSEEKLEEEQVGGGEKTESEEATTPERQSSESSSTTTASSSESETLQDETSSLPATSAVVAAVSESTSAEEALETPPVAAGECESVELPAASEEAAAVEVPIEAEEVETTPVSEPAVAEMDAAPIIQLTESSKMDDEEQSTTAAVALIEQEMTPVEGKMDTDESTTVEAAPMEFEDDAEPMDQWMFSY